MRKAAAQGRGEDGPVPPVLQRRRQAGGCRPDRALGPWRHEQCLGGIGWRPGCVPRLFPMQGCAVAHVQKQPDRPGVRRPAVRPGGGAGARPEEQPEPAAEGLGHAGRHSAALGMLAQAHGGRVRGHAGAWRRVAEKAERLRAPIAPAEAALAAVRAQADGQQPGWAAGRGLMREFPDFFHATAREQGHERVAQAAEKMGVHRQCSGQGVASPPEGAPPASPAGSAAAVDDPL